MLVQLSDMALVQQLELPWVWL
jgi:hypothetical protein